MDGISGNLASIDYIIIAVYMIGVLYIGSYFAKYIHSTNDPPLLFDVESDPNERQNLTGLPEHGELESRIRALVLQRWDNDALSERIRLSQKRRRLVLHSDLQGLRPRWNHDEEPGSDVVWYRGETSYNDWAFKYLPIADQG